MNRSTSQSVTYHFTVPRSTKGGDQTDYATGNLIAVPVSVNGGLRAPKKGNMANPQQPAQSVTQMLEQGNVQMLGNILTALNSAAIQSYLMRPVIQQSPEYIAQILGVLRTLDRMYTDLQEVASASGNT